MGNVNMKLTFESRLEILPALGKAIRGICSCMIHDGLLLYQIELCLIEAVSNVISHAYRNEAGHQIEVDVSIDRTLAVFTVIDTGLRNTKILKKEFIFDPQDINNLPESGMGLHIMFSIMDEVSFIEEQGKNITILKKLLNSTHCKQ